MRLVVVDQGRVRDVPCAGGKTAGAARGDALRTHGIRRNRNLCPVARQAKIRNAELGFYSGGGDWIAIAVH